MTGYRFDYKNEYIPHELETQDFKQSDVKSTTKQLLNQSYLNEQVGRFDELTYRGSDEAISGGRERP